MYTQLADWHGPGPWILLVPLVWIAVVVLVITLLRRTLWRRHGCAFGAGTGVWAGSRLGSGAEHPLAVLGRRYAEGDIDAEEYRARRAVLTEPTSDVPRGGGAA
ncbi:SHOCT domain-containing protein [Kitasatospora sp. SUK 42]|uniref:SHOCT domain-containing protein n=1 Tax=Kitasatospora sp. SUK 42 TaxID=1588882 RepID=UPI0018C97DC0|nr:SHOCT domain-containing protein [Kitasatospora sp. SUK 42]MBV2153813.1 SHOCT domain-containing protein [Kitasatospora sp. SUK 42]